MTPRFMTRTIRRFKLPIMRNSKVGNAKESPNITSEYLSSSITSLKIANF